MAGGLVAALLSACQEDPTVPKIGIPLVELSLSAAKQQIRVGEPDTIRVVARNTLTDAGVRLTFGSTCQILVFVRDSRGRVVVPDGGEHSCLPVPSQLTIPANQSVTQTFVWTGGTAFTPPEPPTALPPGVYFVTASIRASGYSTDAPAVRVTVSP
jgi:hypothetical protein